MPGIPSPQHQHHHRESVEQLIRELKGDLLLLEEAKDLIMDSLQRLQAAASAQGDLIAAAQTRINTLEAAIEAGGGGTPDPTKFVAAADVDAVSTQLEASNAALTALTADAPAPSPPAAG